ncbi:polycystin-1-like protein 2 [Glandiceps talaboti]
MKPGISFKPDRLKNSVRYRLKLNAKLNNITSYTGFDFVTNAPPYDGTCQVVPQKGFGLETEFEIACFDWVDEGIHRIKRPTLLDEGLPPTNTGLLYEFRARKPGFESSDVFYYGPDFFTPPTKLRLGNPNLYIDVRIYDFLGDYTVQTLTVQVQKKPDPLGIRSTELSEMVDGDNSTLHKFIGWGNTVAATQLVAAISSELNFADESANETGNVTTKCIDHGSEKTTVQPSPSSDNETVSTPCVSKTTEKNKSTRSAMLQTMEKVATTIQTKSGAQLVAAAIREGTDKSEEVTLESGFVAINSVKTVTRLLFGMRSSTSDADIAAAKDLVQSIGNVIKVGQDVPKTQGSDSGHQLEDDLEHDEVKKVTNQALDAAHAAAMLAVKDRLVGQEGIVMDSKTLNLQVLRDIPLSLARKSLDTPRGNFKLPTMESLPEIEEGYLNIEVAELTDNYFSWDASAKSVASPVVGLSFTDIHGDEIAVSDTEGWYEVTFNSSSFTYFDEIEGEYAPASEADDGFYYLNITVERANSSVSLYIRPHDERVMYQAYIKYADFPSDYDADLATTIPHDLVNFTKDEIEELDDEQIDELRHTFFLPSEYVTMAGDYFLALRAQANNITKNSEESGNSDPTDIYPGNNTTNSNSENVSTIATSLITTTMKTTLLTSSYGETTNTTSYISSQHTTNESLQPSVSPSYQISNVSHNYTITIFSYGCRYWDEKSQKWLDKDCKVSPLSNTKFSRCLCNHLTSFASDFFVPPNTIKFKDLSFTDFKDNFEVLVFVLSLLLVYVLLILWARRADQRDLVKWAVLPLVDNNEEECYLYEITVVTGIHSESATKSKIRFQVYGEDGDTEVRLLHDGQRELFLRGSVDRFLMSVPKSLGELLYIRIWHDNSGNGDYQSWYLTQFEMLDLQNNKRCYFLCDRWLAVDKADGKVERLVPAAGRDNLLEFSHLCMSTIRSKFSDDHVWFSVVSRPTCSKFTRKQRASCCFALLFLTMIANAMLYIDSEDEARQRLGGKGVDFGVFKISFKEIYTGLFGVFIVTPPTLVIVYLFKECAPLPGDKSILYGWQYLKDYVKYKKGYGSPCIGEEGIEVIIARGKRKKKKLAWYWVYVAWVLVFLSLTVSGVFIIMYSMQWKGEKSRRWLIAMVSSLCCSLLIVEPIKVFAVAFLIALIFKKPSEEERDAACSTEEIQKPEIKVPEITINGVKENESDIESETEDSNGSDKYMTSSSTYEDIPPGTSIKKAREKRDLEIQMKRVIREIGGYLVFLFLLSAIGNHNAGIERSAFNLAVLPIRGKFATYSGGGYEAVLGTNLYEAQQTLEYLFENKWVDQYTRVVFVEFTLYNAQVNYFTHVLITLEWPHATSIYPSIQTTVFRLYDFVGGVFYVIFLIGSHSVYALYLLNTIILILSAVRGSGKKYFYSFWNMYEIIQTMIGFTLVVLYIVRYMATKYFIGDLAEKARRQFVSFQYVAWLNELYTIFIAIGCFFCVAKFLHLFRFNKRLGMLGSTIRYAAKDLVPFFILFMLILMDFATFGFLVFGAVLPDYESFVTSIGSLLLTVIGKFPLEGLDTHHSILGPLYFATFSITCFFVLLNMLISIVNDAYTRVKEDISLQSNDYEIVDFMVQRLHIFRRKVVKVVMKKLKIKRDSPADKYKLVMRKLDVVLLKLERLDDCNEECQPTTESGCV